MNRRTKNASPILGAAAATIQAASRSIVDDESKFNHTFELDIATVTPDPEQPRRVFDNVALSALAETLRSEGQLQPILVRRDTKLSNRWIIVAGERRWRAASLIGWSSILASEFSGDAEVATLLENLQRVDLSPLEEARGIRRLVDGKGWTQDQAAKTLGKTKGEISGTLRILRMPEEVIASVLTSEHPPAKNVLVELARIDDEQTLKRLLSLAAEGGLTVKAIRAARAEPAPPAREKTKVSKGPWTLVDKTVKVVNVLATEGLAIDRKQRASLMTLRDAIDILLEDKTVIE